MKMLVTVAMALGLSGVAFAERALEKPPKRDTGRDEETLTKQFAELNDGGTPEVLRDGGVAAAQPAAPAMDVSKMPFNRETIRKIMMGRVDEVQACYTDILSTKYGKSANAMNGKLVATFVINRKGHVTNAGVLKDRSTVLDPRFRRCVVHILQSTRFPAPKDGRDHPIEFPYALKVTH